MSTINAENIININSSSLKAGTPMLKVNGFYMPVLPESLLTVGGQISAIWKSVDESSILPGTPCVQVEGKTIPLIPFEDNSVGGDYPPGYEPDPDAPDYELSEIGGIAIWGAGNSGANRAYQLYRVDNGLPIFKDGDVYVHPYEYVGKVSASYYFISHYYGDSYTHYYRCSKDTFYKRGTVWQVIPGNSNSKSPAPTTIDVVPWAGS